MLEAEAGALKNGKFLDALDFTRTKLQLDALYMQKRYTEGFELAKYSFEYHQGKGDLRRELVDVYAQFSLKVGDREGMVRCWEWIKEQAKVLDTSNSWCKVRIAEAMGDADMIREACGEYLTLRPGEPLILQILARL